MNAIFFKEWIKTRWYLLLMLLLTQGFVGYSLLRIHRVIELKGAAHLWEVMLTRNAVFVDLLMYLPVIVGVFLALVQYVPEMYHKCLKLTLHLPYPQLKMTTDMLLFGLLALAVLFSLNLLTLYLYLEHYLAVELYSRVLLTALPWYLAGITAYLLISWVCLEPTWMMRVVNLLVSALLLRVYFLSSEPEAYAGFLPWLSVFSLLPITFSWNSIARFKSGKQD